MAAGVATLATVAAVGAGQMMGPGQAHAAFSLPSPTGSIGDVIAALANNGVTQELADQWRFSLCSSDSDGGPVSSGADCSGSTGAGVAVVLPTSIDLVPASAYDPLKDYLNTPGGNVVAEGVRQLAIAAAQQLGVTVDPVPDAALAEGSASILGDGVQFALASGGGKATAIAYLPISVATAGASDGRTAVAFAVVGMANAWTTSAIPVTIFTVPTGLAIPAVKHVSCYGGLTAAYAEDVGACANVLGTFDFRLDLLKDTPEVQFGLTDPSAVLFDPTGVLSQVLGQLLNGQPLTLSKDFARLSFAGDHDLLSGNFVRLTSDYGVQAPITIDWLGQELTLDPMVTVNGQERPNHLGTPVLTLGALDSGEIVPVVHLPEIDFPFGIPTAGPYTVPDITTMATATTVSALAEDTTADGAAADAAPSLLRASAPASDTTPDDQTPVVESVSAGNSTYSPESDNAPEVEVPAPESAGAGYVGRHRSIPAPPTGYVGRHRSGDSDDSGEGARAGSSTSWSGSSSVDTGSSADTGTSADAGSAADAGSSADTGSDPDSGSGSTENSTGAESSNPSSAY